MTDDLRPCPSRSRVCISTLTAPAIMKCSLWADDCPRIAACRQGTSMNPYSSLCDDFGLYVYLNTKMELPNSRETVLHYFDSVRRMYPRMTEFECRDNGEFVLEEDREQGSYRWVTLEHRRVCSGFVNPP